MHRNDLNWQCQEEKHIIISSISFLCKGKPIGNVVWGPCAKPSAAIRWQNGIITQFIGEIQKMEDIKYAVLRKWVETYDVTVLIYFTKVKVKRSNFACVCMCDKRHMEAKKEDEVQF